MKPNENQIRFPKLLMPDFTLPRRGTDCEAVPICEKIGNLHEACMAKGSALANTTQICLQSAVILLGQIAGIALEPPPAEKKIKGFYNKKNEGGAEKK